MTRDDLWLAISRFREAADLDPEFAAPLARIAHAASVMVRLGFTDDPSASMEEALVAANRAILVDRSDSAGFSARSRVHLFFGNADLAIEDAEAAITLNPHSSDNNNALALALYYGRGDARACLPYLDASIRLSPRDPIHWGRLMIKASAHRDLGEVNAAVDAAQRSCQDPDAPYFAFVHLAAALAEAGDVKGAERTLALTRSKEPQISIEFLRRTLVQRHPDTMAKLEASLRKAGLP